MKQPNSSQGSKENKSENFFDPIRNENYDDTFPRAERWLRTANSNLLNDKKEGKLTFMKKYFAVNKLKLAYTFLILAFLVAACNYPVTQNESIGDVLTWEVPVENMEVIKSIESNELLKNGDYTCNYKGVGGKKIAYYSLVLKDISPEKVSEFKSQLQSTAGVMHIKAVPINEPVVRPLYSAALNEIFKININATNKSDEELRNEILEQLKKAGIDNAQIQVESDAKGNRMIKFNRPLDDHTGNSGFDMTIQDGDKVNRLKEVRKTGSENPDRFKGKSDAEIRQMVKEDFKEIELTDDQIEIIRDGEKVSVKVKAVKNKGNMNEELELEQKTK